MDQVFLVDLEAHLLHLHQVVLVCLRGLEGQLVQEFLVVLEDRVFLVDLALRLLHLHQVVLVYLEDRQALVGLASLLIPKGSTELN
jgi:hypothetical protein